MKRRASGVLMHISSLPGDFGIGTFGQNAYDFVDFLVETNQTYWQILPLTTTSYGDSPYQSFSAIAGNPHLIDFEALVAEGWLEPEDLEGQDFGADPTRVDYAKLYQARRPILEKAVAAFRQDQSQAAAFRAFEEEQAAWLGDYADFMAIKEHYGNVALQEWPNTALIQRQKEALEAYRMELQEEISYQKVVQYFFFNQWAKLKAYANDQGIAIIGDMPIYVSADSVEVWTMPDLFKLDDQRCPLFLAGCPADEFSPDGQLWGNPIYDWDRHAETGYAWWIYRIQESFKLYDYLRIDHFKGFSDYWEIDGDAETANEGKWQPGPQYALFAAVKEALGDLPIIAEDLGYIDDRAKQLLADCGYPGMKILQFGFYDISGQSIDIPHRCVPHGIAYTGTHDNEVINGWYDKLDQDQVDFVNAYTNRRPDEPISQAMLRTLFATVSNTVIASMQDILDLPASSRMNLPSTVGGNWEWRMVPEDLTADRKAFLKGITRLYQRGNKDHD